MRQFEEKWSTIHIQSALNNTIDYLKCSWNSTMRTDQFTTLLPPFVISSHFAYDNEQLRRNTSEKKHYCEICSNCVDIMIQIQTYICWMWHVTWTRIHMFHFINCGWLKSRSSLNWSHQDYVLRIERELKSNIFLTFVISYWYLLYQVTYYGCSIRGTIICANFNKKVWCFNDWNCICNKCSLWKIPGVINRTDWF